jgi:hypothetical protein
LIDTTTQELSREQCMEILGWASYAGFSDEQLQAAVHNQRVRQRWGSQPPESTATAEQRARVDVMGDNRESDYE